MDGQSRRRLWILLAACVGAACAGASLGVVIDRAVLARDRDECAAAFGGCIRFCQRVSEGSIPMGRPTTAGPCEWPVQPTPGMRYHGAAQPTEEPWPTKCFAQCLDDGMSCLLGSGPCAPGSPLARHPY